MDEIFDVVDEADRVLFQAPRAQVHAERWFHRAVHIFVVNSAGQLLVHRRTASKDECPLRHTSSASGHLQAGEDYLTAAHRELAEELGLHGELEFLVKLFEGAETSCEHSALYRLVSDASPTFDPKEIESGEYRSLEDIARWMDARPDDFTPCFRVLFRWYCANAE